MAEDGMAEVVSFCLAVLEVGLGLIAAVLAVMHAPRRRWPRHFARPRLAGVPRRHVFPSGCEPVRRCCMDMEMSMLEDAKRFDQMFIDMMVPHHQGAIRMARIELAEGNDSRLQEIATAIIDAQSREIEGMNEWRVKWCGSPSPAGGVPSEDDALSVTRGDGPLRQTHRSVLWRPSNPPVA
jgi:hypothetical protein